MICSSYQRNFGRANKEECNGSEYGAYGVQERRIHGFGGEAGGKETAWKAQA
jgi:hypothetical protein